MPTQNIHPKLRSIPLEPKNDEVIIAAVDTSSMKFGETNRGMMVAVRGASVWKQSQKYRYVRLGPFIFHITEENKREVYDALQRSRLGFHNNHDNLSSPNIGQMPTRMASLLERWFQTMLLKSIRKGVVLFDGSLTSGTADTPIHLMKEILEIARERANVVLAFSKMTNLRFNGHPITDVLLQREPPCLLEISELKTEPPIVLMGNVYVAKLTKGNYSFRLDIDKQVTSRQRIESVERLLGNDLFFQSYPETLRLAHILCTFTANEVIAMQHFTTSKYGIQIINKPDIHRVLFGPFGKGESS